jgi:beta-glucosidase
MTLAPYRQPDLPIEERVSDLLARMTLREKVGQLNQRLYGWDACERYGDGVRLTGAFTAEVARWDGMGALYGLLRSDPWSGRTLETGIGAGLSARAANAVQRWVRENTRLGIPVLLVEECPHGHQALDSTVLPVNLAVGASWDPRLLRTAAAHVAAQLRARGGHIALVSALDMLMDPRWGRSEECFGEDPHLAAVLTDAVVRGMQGDPAEYFPADKAAVVLKHFAAQGAGAGGHNAGPVPIGPRELREIHLPAARAGIRAGAAGVMAAYNEIDGVPCAANAGLLTDLLRGQWGFEGIVMSDAHAVDRVGEMTGDPLTAAATALRAGVDLSMWDDAYTMIEAAIRDGLAAEADVDRAVARVLRLKFRLGLFEQPYVAESAPPPPERELSTEMARRALVLLRNHEDLLPLPPGLAKIAVIGPNAHSVLHQSGDYTAPQPPGTGTTVLDGVRDRAAGAQVRHVRGCFVVAPEPGGIAAAREAAAWADAVVLVLGGSSAREEDTVFAQTGAVLVDGRPTQMTAGEGVDLADITLPAAQRELARAVASTGTPTVAVLVQGRPHALGGVDDLCGAVLCAWYPGPDGGAAVASVLFGDTAPSGRLPVSVPRSSGQLPVTYNARQHHSSYVDQPGTAAYPFGFGLGYTTFRYEDLGHSVENGRVTVRVTVRNTGHTAGTETVQLYIRRLASDSWPRRRELVAFRQVTLDPGRTADLDLSFDAPAAGRLLLLVGPDSATDALTLTLDV